MKPNIKLSQCMIVKNEEKNIERALSWGKKITCEQIVVDTGSTDRTVEIAKQMGAAVYHFAWIDDFSAAKNFALEKATGNWIVFLDADEFFTEKDILKLSEILQELEEKNKLNQILAITCSLVNLDDFGQIGSVGEQTRVFRNRKELRFHNRIHERLQLTTGEELAAYDATGSIAIQHSGYSHSMYTETDKLERNIRLLRKELEANPQDEHAMLYLAESLLASGKTGEQEAESLLDQILNLVKNGKYVFRQDSAFFCRMHLLIEKKPKCDENSLKEIYHLFKSTNSNYPDLDYLMGKWNARYGNWKETIYYLETALEKQKIYTGSEQIYMLRDQVYIYYMLATAYQELSDTMNAVRYCTIALQIEPYSEQILLPLLSIFISDVNTTTSDIIGFLEKLYKFEQLKAKLFLYKCAKKLAFVDLEDYIYQSFSEEEREWFDEKETLARLQGEALMREGDLDGAKITIEQRLEINGDNFELYFMLGQYYEVMHNVMASMLCYRYAIFLSKTGDDVQSIKEYYTAFLEKHSQLKPLKTAVIMCGENNRKWLNRSTELIKKYNPEDSFEIIYSGFINGGVNYNDGIEKSENETDILILEKFTYLMPYTLFHLQLASVTMKSTGILTPVQSEDKSGKNSWKNTNLFTGHVMLGGTAYYITRNLLKSCGQLDNKFYNLEYQMADLGFRAIQQGYFLYQIYSAFVEVSNAQNNLISAQERQRFQDKWKFDPSYSCFARKDILEKMQPETETEHNFRILEVGCACGATLLAIKEHYPHAHLYGIELEEGPAMIAQNFAEVITGNIENMIPNYELDFFDYIIFGDVLEHLRKPELILKKMRPYLKRGGKILASIPNVMHISVVKGLLEGHWNYEDAGILDRTHLRFFTCESALNMFRQAGYEVQDVGIVQIQLSSEEEKLTEKLSAIGGVSPLLFKSYQYIVQASRKE